ncbi:MAG TPA: BON domain-containing protein [Candidatus Angelobacter sp.]
MMRRILHTLALLTVFSLVLAGALAAAQQSPAQQNPPAQAQPPQEAPPHVDAQTNPEDRKTEQAIQSALGQDPHMAYSNVQVRATDTEVTLTGTVLTATAKDQAEKIAADQAGGRKITNKIRVNPNIHPGPGL